MEQSHRERIARFKKEKKEWTFDDDISGIDISMIQDDSLEPEKSAEVKRLERLMQGKWYLTNRYTSYEERFFRYDGSKKGYVILSDNLFTLSTAGIEFSGEFVVHEPFLLGSVSRNLPKSEQFLLHVMNFASSMSVGAQPHVYYWGEIRGDVLVLSNLGSHISKSNPPEELLFFER